MSFPHKFRDPWIIPVDSQGRARLKQLKERLGAAVGGRSDHLILVRLYDDWAALPPHKQYRFAVANYLSNSTLLMIQGMRGQLMRELWLRGLMHTQSVKGHLRAATDNSIVRQVLVRSSHSSRSSSPQMCASVN
jgi:hypothetical protein